MDWMLERLRAVADPTWVDILRLLVELPDEHVARDPRWGTAYGVCFCHLKERTGLSAPTVSHHLRLLREAGLGKGFGWDGGPMTGCGRGPSRPYLLVLARKGREQLERVG